MKSTQNSTPATPTTPTTPKTPTNSFRDEFKEKEWDLINLWLEYFLINSAKQDDSKDQDGKKNKKAEALQKIRTEISGLDALVERIKREIAISPQKKATTHSVPSNNNESSDKVGSGTGSMDYDSAALIHRLLLSRPDLEDIADKISKEISQAMAEHLLKMHNLRDPQGDGMESYFSAEPSAESLPASSTLEVEKLLASNNEQGLEIEKLLKQNNDLLTELAKVENIAEDLAKFMRNSLPYQEWQKEADKNFTLKKQYEEKCNEVDSLRTNLEREISNQKPQLDRLTQESVRLNQELAEASTKHEAILLIISSELSSTKNSLDKSLKTNGELSLEKEALEKKLRELSEKQQSVDRENAQEISLIKDQLGSVRKENQELLSERASINDKNQFLQNRNQDLTKSLADAEKKLKDKESELRREFAKESRKLNEELASIKKEKADTSEKLSLSKKLSENLRKEQDQLMDDLVDVTITKEALEEARKKNIDLENHLRTSKETLEEARSKNIDLENHLKTAQQDLAKAASGISKLETRAEREKNTRDRLNEALSLVEARNLLLELSNKFKKELRMENTELREENDGLKRELLKAQLEFLLLNQDLKSETKFLHEATNLIYHLKLNQYTESHDEHVNEEEEETNYIEYLNKKLKEVNENSKDHPSLGNFSTNQNFNYKPQTSSLGLDAFMDDLPEPLLGNEEEAQNYIEEVNEDSSLDESSIAQKFNDKSWYNDHKLLRAFIKIQKGFAWDSSQSENGSKDILTNGDRHVIARFFLPADQKNKGGFGLNFNEEELGILKSALDLVKGIKIDEALSENYFDKNNSAKNLAYEQVVKTDADGKVKVKMEQKSSFNSQREDLEFSSTEPSGIVSNPSAIILARKKQAVVDTDSQNL